MSLYNAKSADEFYRIIKSNYKYYNMDVDNMSYNINTIIKHLLEETMSSTQFLDYSFATDYIKLCKYYYKITCNNCIFNIISIVRPNINDIRKNINDVMNIKNLYNIQKPLTYYISLNTAKRYFAKKGEVMQAKHINGGFTNPYSNKIYIVRKQEYAKVMLHELLHHCRHINKYDWHPTFLARLKNHFNIHKECKFYPNEAVVETLAHLIYVCLSAMHRRMSFKMLLKKEKEYSCALAHRIIKMQNNKTWYEETNTYCYVILKSIFLCNFDRFIIVMKNEKHLTNLLLKYDIPYINQPINRLQLVYIR